MQIKYKTGLWILLAVAAFVAVCLLTPARVLFDQVALVMKLQQFGSFASLFFVVGFAIATVFGFPGNVLTIAGGAAFGLFWGTVWSLIGATIGSVGAFWVTRSLFHDMAARRFGHHPMLQRLNQAIVHRPLNFVLAVRFTPLSPFSLVNFLFGLTPIDLKTYTLGTMLGIIPLTLTYSWLGATGNQAFTGRDRLPFFLALTTLALLALLPMMVKKRRRNEVRSPESVRHVTSSRH